MEIYILSISYSFDQDIELFAFADVEKAKSKLQEFISKECEEEKAVRNHHDLIQVNMEADGMYAELICGNSRFANDTTFYQITATTVN